jgi:hypothetical protein
MNFNIFDKKPTTKIVTDSEIIFLSSFDPSIT